MHRRHLRQLDRHQAAYIRDETYSAALAELVNTQHAHPFAAQWGDSTTSSADGQRFRAGSKAESTGHVNPKYGADPGIQEHYIDTAGLTVHLFARLPLPERDRPRLTGTGQDGADPLPAGLAPGFEQQRYRASGLNLVTAAIVPWNTIYLDRTGSTPADDTWMYLDDLTLTNG